MGLTAEDYAYLSADTYHERPQGKRVHLNGRWYEVKLSEHGPYGYYGAAYQPVDPPENALVIVERGTVVDRKQIGATLKDVGTDAAMVVTKVNPQVTTADEFTRKALQFAERNRIPRDQITLAGHSLGGTLAEIESWRFGLGGQTFNAYGAAGLGYGVPEDGTRIIDNVLD